MFYDVYILEFTDCDIGTKWNMFKLRNIIDKHIPSNIVSSIAHAPMVHTFPENFTKQEEKTLSGGPS